MSDLSDVLPPKNHNKPPNALADELDFLQANIELRHIEVIQEVDKHIALAKKIPQVFTDDNEANFVSDYIKKVTVAQKELEKRRKEEKEPFFRQGKFVDEFFGDLKTKLDLAIESAKKPLNDYLQKKAIAEKLEREAEAAAMKRESDAAFFEMQKLDINKVQGSMVTQTIDHFAAMQKVAQVADQRAAIPVAALARAEGEYSKAELKTEIVGRIIDRNELDLNKLRPYLKEDELQRALNAFIKMGGRELAGAEIKEQIVTKVK